MKYKRHVLALSIVVALSATSFGVPIVENYDFSGISQAIPDGNASGLANFQPIVSAITNIESVTVSLDISGPYSGDLYAYLTHDTGFSVLLNRSGRTLANSFGYGDAGFSVTLDDLAVNNIHTYQDQTIPTPGSPLTGIWQPDGRNIDPDFVLDTTPSTATLATFNGLDADGNWTLFVADLSGGDAHTLDSWGMTITGIPEPSIVMMVAAGTIIIMLARKRRKFEDPVYMFQQIKSEFFDESWES